MSNKLIVRFGRKLLHARDQRQQCSLMEKIFIAVSVEHAVVAGEL